MNPETLVDSLGLYNPITNNLLLVALLAPQSYVPAGLTAAQYNAQRSKERSAKEKNYQKNVAKAGKFEDYTDFYLKRGTDQNGSWLKAANRGHKMVKTKYDWDGGDGTPLKDMKQFESGVKKGKAAGKNGKFMFGKK